jgi:tRNA threonylcarbamoyl adenosine modification protein (Sua5/YciO/YrdC/YwlC family)
MNKEPLLYASTIIRNGGLVACPTESIFGLDCDPNNNDAIKKLIRIKNRSFNKGFILAASSLNQLQPFISTLTNQQKEKILQINNLPITWIVPAKKDINPNLSGGRETIAIRVTQHPILQQLCDSLCSALISTSANPSDMPPAKSVVQVQEYFGTNVDYIIDGELGECKNPSEIRDLLTDEVIREG